MLDDKKLVPTLRQEVKVKVDIVTSDDIKIYHTGKFQDFTASYVIKVLNMIIFVFYWVESIMGKGKNAGYQHFLLFPQCFQKASLSA